MTALQRAVAELRRSIGRAVTAVNAGDLDAARDHLADAALVARCAWRLSPKSCTPQAGRPGACDVRAQEQPMATNTQTLPRARRRRTSDAAALTFKRDAACDGCGRRALVAFTSGGGWLCAGCGAVRL
jgi:hypothetical protein